MKTNQTTTTKTQKERQPGSCKEMPEARMAQFLLSSLPGQNRIVSNDNFLEVNVSGPLKKVLSKYSNPTYVLESDTKIIAIP